MKFVKPSCDIFVEPSKRYADVVLPNTNENGMESNTAVNMIVEHIRCKIMEREFARSSSQEQSSENSE